MIISIQIGAHGTNGETLTQTLRRNERLLAERGVIVPKKHVYRELLPEIMRRVQDEPADLQTQEALINELTDGYEAQRIVLSFEELICMPQLVFHNDALYAKSEFKLPWLSNVFADQHLEFFFGVRNPATFVPEVFSYCGPHIPYGQFMGNMMLEDILWAPLIKRMMAAAPAAKFTAYVYEDTPITWPQILHEMTGLDPYIKLSGELDVIAEVMQRDGLSRLGAYLETHKPRTEVQRKRILSSFLEKYVDPHALDADLEFQGWTQELVDMLGAQYEEDLYALEEISGLNLIQI